MKKVTLSINGIIKDDVESSVSGALNDLSGVVAADMVQSEGKAYAYAGDRLDKSVLEEAVRKSGYTAHVISEDYLEDVKDFKASIN